MTTVAATSSRPSHGRRVSPAVVTLAPPIGFLAVFFVAPMGFMVATSLTVKGAADVGPSLANYGAFLEKSFLWGALANSVELTLLTILFSLPLAYATAAAIAFATPARWRPLLLALLVLPFFASFVVRTYAWLLVLADKGVINGALASLGLIEAPLRLVNSRTGVLIVFVHYFVMIMALSIYVNLARIPPNLIRAARDLGASGFDVFRHVILPLSTPGVAVGVFLTIVIAIGDYITPQVIGGGQELTLPQAIMLQVGRFANIPLASALSFVLTVLILAALVAFLPWLRGRRAS